MAASNESVPALIPPNLSEQAQKASPEAIQTKLNEVNALSTYLQSVKSQKQSGEQDLSPLLDSIKSNLDKERAVLQNMITSSQALLAAQKKEINLREGEIKTKEQVIQEHDQKIADQRSLMLLRDRMLQLSQEKNIWKQKVIYTLFTLIIAVFMIMMVGYVFFSGKPQ